MKITTEYKLGEIVYLLTDVEQLERIVTGISIRETGVSYELSCGTISSWNYDMEISREKNLFLD